MKIAFLMQESRMGGIEYNSVHLAAALEGKADIIFVVPGTGPLTERLTRENLPYLIYSRPPFISTSISLGKNSVFNPFATLYNFFLFPSLSFKLAKLFKQEHFQMVMTKGLLSNFYGASAARLAGIRSIWDMQEIVSKVKILGFLSWTLNIWALLFVDKIIVSSTAIAGQFWARIQKKVAVIPNGIDTDYYNPKLDRVPVRKEWGVAADEVLIAHIARFTYWKGQMDFVKAAALLKDKMPNLKFALVGSPVFENEHYEKEVKRLAADLGLKDQILFPGFRDDLGNVLAAADIFIHSSIESEGCPITLITAMGMGKACIVTNVRGNDEIVNIPGSQALFIDPENPGQMAEAVIKILKNPDIFSKLQRFARDRILERYSLEAYAGNCNEVFKRCIV